MTKKAITYNLIIDEDRNKILNGLINFLCQDEEVFKDVVIGNLGISTDVVLDFFEEITRKEHESNWCLDPKCEYNENA